MKKLLAGLTLAGTLVAGIGGNAFAMEGNNGNGQVTPNKDYIYGQVKKQPIVVEQPPVTDTTSVVELTPLQLIQKDVQDKFGQYGTITFEDYDATNEHVIYLNYTCDFNTALQIHNELRDYVQNTLGKTVETNGIFNSMNQIYVTFNM
ncbi:hypothetical protein V2I71_12725 [Peribacillus frigoritolerans]|uniref:hypothetical protein n=1 Tax=Peribacillus frigoritolerans TaxID=450367 RepID=UPI002ED40C82|nr:hypothetical protein V2I71_12725 [Peribacillus frigoritolerans]